MHQILWFLGLVLATPGVTQVPGAGWSLVHLDLDVTLEPDKGRLRGIGHAKLRLDRDTPSKELGLAINARKALMEFIDVQAAGARFETGIEVSRRPHARLALLRFEKEHEPGAEIEVKFSWGGSGTSRQFAVTSGCAFASWVEAWYPFPVPGTKTQSLSSRMRAPGSTRFRLPESWHACGNGKLVESQSIAGGTVETWKSEHAVARSFAAGPYDIGRVEKDGRQFSVYLLTAKPLSSKGQVDVLARSIRAMEAKLGPYPYASFGIAELPRALGSFYASSEQGFIMVKPGVFAVKGGNVPLFAHEAAHGWWGNLVGTREPGAKVCSETLAQYCAVVAIEALEGPAAATEFLEFSRRAYSPRQCARGYFDILRRGGDKPLAKLSRGRFDHDLSDSKGHWVFHMLRRRVGDRTFFATLRTLIRDHANESMSLRDVQEAFTKAAPKAELGRFFEQWFEREGAPVLELDWKPAKDTAGHAVDLAIKQTQKGKPYHLRVDIAVRVGSEDERHTVTLEKAETRVLLRTKGKPVGASLDPERRLLIWRPEYGRKPE